MTNRQFEGLEWILIIGFSFVTVLLRWLIAVARDIRDRMRH